MWESNVHRREIGENFFVGSARGKQRPWASPLSAAVKRRPGQARPPLQTNGHRWIHTATDDDRARHEAHLRDTLSSIVCEFLGPPNRQLSNRNIWRWGRKGSLAVHVAGSQRGSWFDFEAGIGGGPLGLIARLSGQSIGNVRRELIRRPMRTIAMSTGSEIANRALSNEKSAADEKTRRALELWQRSEPINGTIGEIYLRHRHAWINPPPACLRFLNDAPIGDGAKGPALLALITSAIGNTSTGIHVTPLLCDGSDRDRTRTKRIYGRAKGSIIRLSDDETVTEGLFLCEGIETGMSILAQGIAPVWCAISTAGLVTFPLLEGIASLTILADHDSAGIEAATRLARRYQAEKRDVRILVPKHRANDFNDIVAHLARTGDTP